MTTVNQNSDENNFNIHKAQVYKNMKELYCRHKVVWIKHCVEELTSLPQEKEQLYLLAELHRKLDNPQLKTYIESKIENYPNEWLANFSIRKKTRNTCASFTESIVYHCSFEIDKGFFMEKMQSYGSKKPHAEICHSYLMCFVRDKAHNQCGITSRYVGRQGDLLYELKSEKDRQTIKKCLTAINENLDLDFICEELTNCDEKMVRKFFEIYNLTSELEKAHPKNNNNPKKAKI